MDASTSPLQDGTPAEPTPYADPDRVFADIIYAIDEFLPGFVDFCAATAQERGERVAPILAAMRKAGAQPEPEAGP